jgi:hypothetical protein
MAHRPIGTGTSITTSGTASTTSAFVVQSDSIRIVALDENAFVKVNSEPIATKADYLVVAGRPETLAMTKASQRVVGITTGATTIITCPEGTQMPFVVGDRVTLSAANDAEYTTAISHAEVTAVNTTSSYDGNFQTSITVNADTSGIVTAFAHRDSTLRRSFKVSAITEGGSGQLYVQQVQVSGAS